MNDIGYNKYDGRWTGGNRSCKPARSMKQIKADYNASLQRHALSKTRPH